MTDPLLVSCICPTRGNPKHVARAIECFEAQSYANKEMVLVYEGPGISSDPGLRLPMIKSRVLLLDSPAATVGAKRNFALRRSRGEFIAVWDDDDWHAPTRLEEQIRKLLETGQDASVLDQVTLFDEEHGTAHKSVFRPWENTLVSRREPNGFDLRWEDATRGGDTPLVERIFAAKRGWVLNSLPELYVYSFHGKNLWDRRHHESIRLEAMSRADSERIGALLGVAPKL